MAVASVTSGLSKDLAQSTALKRILIRKIEELPLKDIAYAERLARVAAKKFKGEIDEWLDLPPPILPQCEETQMNATLCLAEEGPPDIIIDSGASRPMLGMKICSTAALASKTEVKDSVVVKTGTTKEPIEHEIEFSIPSIKMTSKANLLKNSPNVQALGELCMEKGFGHYWPPYGKPVLVLPDTHEHVLVPIKIMVPHLPTKDADIIGKGEMIVPDFYPDGGYALPI